MSWKNLVGICINMLGLILFLYGSNRYNAFAGWTGIFLVILGLLLGIILRVYGHMRRERSVQDKKLRELKIALREVKEGKTRPLDELIRELNLEGEI